METIKRNRRPIPDGITADNIITKLAEINNSVTDFIGRVSDNALATFNEKNYGILFRRLSDIADDFDAVTESAIARASGKAEKKERARKANPKAAARREILDKQRIIRNLQTIVNLLQKQNVDASSHIAQINRIGMEIENLRQTYGITEIKSPGRPRKN
jgi:hypothetical protein